MGESPPPNDDPATTPNDFFLVFLNCKVRYVGKYATHIHNTYIQHIAYKICVVGNFLHIFGRSFSTVTIELENAEKHPLQLHTPKRHTFGTFHPHSSKPHKPRKATERRRGKVRQGAGKGK